MNPQLYGIGGRSHPSTAILDNFNRATLGANWSVLAGNLSLDANQLRTTGGAGSINVGIWNVATYGPDIEVYASMAAIPTSGYRTTLYLRFDSGLGNSYFAQIDSNGSVYIRRTDTGVPINLVSKANAVTLTAGATFTFRAVGSTLSTFYNGMLVLSTTDATYATANSIGVGIEGGSNARWDNFGGGTI